MFNFMQISRDMEITDDSGKKMKALKVFGAIIEYLKTHILKLLDKRGSEFVNEDIHWILTVPAIWTDSAKQFMREAAYTVNLFPVGSSDITIKEKRTNDTSPISPYDTPQCKNLPVI